MSLKWHPDKNTKSEEDRIKADKMFKEINEAKAVLTDREKRDKYDQGFDLEDINTGRADHGFGGGGGGHGGHGGFGGMDPSDLFSMFMGSQGGGMGGGMGGGRSAGQ